MPDKFNYIIYCFLQSLMELELIRKLIMQIMVVITFLSFQTLNIGNGRRKLDNFEKLINQECMEKKFMDRIIHELIGIYI